MIPTEDYTAQKLEYTRRSTGVLKRGYVNIAD